MSVSTDRFLEAMHGAKANGDAKRVANDLSERFGMEDASTSFSAERTAATLTKQASQGKVTYEDADTAISAHLSEQLDLERALQAQVASLNVMFERFASVAISLSGNAASCPDALKVAGELALRCQAQQRQAIEAIARIRNPRVTTFVKSYVDKQINQLVQQQSGDRQLRLQEDTHAPMDEGIAQEAGKGDKEVETVGEKHRTKNRRRKG